MDMENRLDRLAASGDIRGIVSAAMRARISAAEGKYCECDTPLVVGVDLMCGSCLLENREQEIKRVRRSVDTHDFAPGKLGGLMCAVCTQAIDVPRHHGQPAVGRTSWGTSVVGI